MANFETLIAFCVGYGGDYKPTNPLIEIPALQTLLAHAQAALDDVQTKLAPRRNKVADRENIYEGIRRLTTRKINLSTSGIAEERPWLHGPFNFRLRISDFGIQADRELHIVVI